VRSGPGGLGAHGAVHGVASVELPTSRVQGRRAASGGPGVQQRGREEERAAASREWKPGAAARSAWKKGRGHGSSWAFMGKNGRV
jgi:hypothetical protein